MKGKGYFFLIAALLVANVAAGRDLDIVTKNGVSYIRGEVIVKFKNAAPDLAVEGAEGFVLKDVKRNFAWLGTHVVNLNAGVTVEGALTALQGHPSVIYAEPNYLCVPLNTVPNDPFFGELWGLYNSGQVIAGQAGVIDADMDVSDPALPDAWDTTTGSADVIVAVIDTGIQHEHEDLVGNIWENPLELVGTPDLDDDGNGYIDDIYGWDFFNDDNTLYDSPAIDMHGTHVAGTIGAVGDNGIGVVGVNWTVKIMPVKFLGGGGGTTEDAILAIEYAVDNGADILNNSWGGGGYSQALRNAIVAADAEGVLFVAAAGNNGSNNDYFPAYPASYDVPNVISVAATDNGDLLALFSNYGETSVAVAAPGVDIYSTIPIDGYDYMDGTSMAAPHVSGVAALVKAAFPAYTHTEIKGQILGTVDLKPDLSGRILTGGRVNAQVAVTAVPEPRIFIKSWTLDDSIAVDPANNANGYADPGETVDVTIILLNTWLDATGVTGVLAEVDPLVTVTSAASGYPDIASGEEAACLIDYQFTVDPAHAPVDVVDFNLTISANGGGYIVIRTFKVAIVGGMPGGKDTLLVIDDGVADDFTSVWETAVDGTAYAADYITTDISGAVDMPIDLIDPGPEYIIWTTGNEIRGTLTVQEQNFLRTYLLLGGNLFLSSQGILNEYGAGPGTFARIYLKCGSEQTGPGNGSIPLPVVGTAGDPIGEALTADLNWDPAIADILDGADAMVPDSGAAGWLSYDDPGVSTLDGGTCGIRVPGTGMGLYNCVFMSAPFEAIDAPADQVTVMERILDFLHPDVTAPNNVGDLAAVTGSTEGEIDLAWTAVGDDGAIGTADSYDIRWRAVAGNGLDPITVGNWDLAVPVFGPPAPKASTQPETLTVVGLAPSIPALGVWYWYCFAMIVNDEAGNPSGLSNPAWSTAAPDVTPPAAVPDLTVENTITLGKVKVSWTATGDNGDLGKAASYDLRYNTVLITDVNWGVSPTEIEIAAEPAPAFAGTDQSMYVAGLVADTTYYFALKVDDETPVNTSGLSNVASVTIPASGGVGGVGGTVFELALSSTASGLRLGWVNPLRLDYAGAIIVVGEAGTPTSISDGLQIASVKKPGVSFVHDDALSGKTYHYSLFIYTTDGNVSSDKASITGSLGGGGGGGGGGGCFVSTAR